jgi:Ca-activated chloride channel family protein
LKARVGQVRTSALQFRLLFRAALLTASFGALSSVESVRAAKDRGTPQFSAGVQLVEVYVTVTDPAGGLVLGLRQEDFDLREDGRPQAISAFAVGEFPLTVALGLDRSWSMAGRPLRLAKQASQGFLRQLTGRDRSMVVSIGSDAEVLAPLGVDRSRQSALIAGVDPWGTTSLHDATIATLDRLEHEPGRQAFVMFSDGVDRYSRATATAVVARARRSQALIYPIAVGRSRPPFLAELAVVTGGRSFWLKDVGELGRTLTTIAKELRSQYLIGYAPSRPIEGTAREWRSIRVDVRSAARGVRVRARDGYETE